MLRSEYCLLRNIGRVTATFGRRSTPIMARSLCSLTGRNMGAPSVQYYAQTSFSPLDPFSMVRFLPIAHAPERIRPFQAQRQQAEDVAEGVAAAIQYRINDA